MGSDCISACVSPARFPFQSTPPAWGATHIDFIFANLFAFQSTLPHGERPCVYAYVDDAKEISIHAPAWGATPLLFSFDDILLFQSTLPHGERLYVPVVPVTPCRFQSTLPHGERPASRGDWLGHSRFQSTLPHGERPLPSFRSSVLQYFNPRSRMGSDREIHRSRGKRQDFNPRSRMGSDTTGKHDNLPEDYFNPRSRMGSDVPGRDALFIYI